MFLYKCIISSVFASLLISPFCGNAAARHKENPKNTIVNDIKPADESRPVSSDAYRQHLLNAVYDSEKANQLPEYQQEYSPEAFKTQIKGLTAWPVKATYREGTLLFSDSPETVYQDGILYQDTVQGKGRLYYYHVNGTDQDKKVVVVLTNESLTNDVDFLITRSAQTGPDADYFYVGKSSQLRYFGYQSPRHILLAQGCAQILENRTNSVNVPKDGLVCGIYDFQTDKPVKITVMMLPLDADPYVFIKTAAILPKDESRLRGTFKNMDRTLLGEKLYDPDKDGSIYFTLADDHDDTYLTGIDATDNSSVKNYGNYGVLYYLSIPTVGMRKVHYYLQPLGGAYAGAMAVQINNNPDFNILPTPSDCGFFGQNPRQNYYADLGTYSAKDNVMMEFSPPGASNLPINIILSPE